MADIQVSKLMKAIEKTVRTNLNLSCKGNNIVIEKMDTMTLVILLTIIIVMAVSVCVFFICLHVYMKNTFRQSFDWKDFTNYLGSASELIQRKERTRNVGAVNTCLERNSNLYNRQPFPRAISQQGQFYGQYDQKRVSIEIIALFLNLWH